MPTCLVYSQACRPALLSPAHNQAQHVIYGAYSGACRRYRPRSSKTPRRAASSATATALKGQTRSPSLDSQRHHALTIWHHTKSLLPRVLPPNAFTESGVTALEFWEDVLQKTYQDLCPNPEAKAGDRLRIAVYGCDRLSGAQELIAALLEGPFASDSQRELIRSRWKSATAETSTLVIEYGAPTDEVSGGLRLRSSWLQQFGVPIQVLECRCRSVQPSSAIRVPKDAAKELLTADIPIVVCNPATTSLTALLSPEGPIKAVLNHPNSILVLTSASGSSQVAEQVFALTGGRINLHFIDPNRALDALRTLSSASSSPAAVQRYQDDYAGSRLSQLTGAVSSVITSGEQNVSPRTTIESLHLETAHASVTSALITCRSVLKEAQREVDQVVSDIGSLRSQVQEVQAKVDKEVFGTDNRAIRDAVSVSKKDLKTAMDALPWWRLFWKVDDVGESVLAAVDQVFCRDLENRLVFHAGRIASLQQSFVDSANKLVTSFPSRSPFHSPVLQNALSQISSAPSFPVSVTALTQPIYARRQQLRFPTARLQSTAQRVLLGMSGSVFSGMGVAWAGWAGQLGIFDMAVQMETALAVGMLGAVAGVRWSIGHFERAKRKWWQDYDRVGMGLERDLTATLHRTMEQHVYAVPEKAYEGLTELASKRDEEILELQDDVNSLDDGLSSGPNS
ncbi:hypothetical protein WOLCODRAFT_103422 [Wolfiporia cocos MD-104 SS10]|uniref:Mmc1 C-terminal domain-containing protein n=1 Tax=Wolfiporia cocos (strain MD-104) TaxID=742152 RepID=A0A2H3JNB0_WOLCO|nr:hypothetical protein WOLCODRAFT_103422 [Wolfiporia cocos MD-104 SS10]